MCVIDWILCYEGPVMSEDNGTYVLALRDGYKVSQLHAVENLFDDTKHLVSAYDEKITWDTSEKALNYALMLEMGNQTEYGILYIKDYQKQTWKELQEWVSLSS